VPIEHRRDERRIAPGENGVNLSQFDLSVKRNVVKRLASTKSFLNHQFDWLLLQLTNPVIAAVDV
jgi:hypothetical protein